MKNEIVNPPESETSEFRGNKDSYCPQCYFDDDKKVLSTACKHNTSTNILTEKVKQLNDDLKDIVYKLTGGRIDGTEQLFISLLEADVQRNKTQLYDQMANLVIGDNQLLCNT